MSPTTQPLDQQPPPRVFDDLQRAADDCAALAQASAAVTESQRSLAPGLADALKASGLLRTGVPAALGGTEAPPGVTLQTAETVARGDASAGWCVSIAATTGLLAAYLSQEGANEAFGDPRSTAAGVWAPHGTGRRADGGIELTGRWSYCSGVTHSDWLFVGYVLDDGLRGDGAPPVLQIAGVPTSEVEIIDTWRTSGLRGTGSHDVAADAVYVPEHRILSILHGPPESATPLYRFPLFGFFALSIAAAALGNARGAIDDLLVLAAAKKPTGSSKTLAERPSTQAAVAQAEAALRAARLLFYRSIDEAWEAAQGHDPVPETLRVGLRLAASHGTRTAADVASAMYELGGGAAIYEDSPLQRRFRDAHTATAHFQVNAASFELTGRLLLGLPTRTEQL